MPEIFRFFGFSFFFYSKEHEPLHIHVEGNGGMAKFEWDGKSLKTKHQSGRLQKNQSSNRGKH